jgi:hypothetical protein
MGTKRVGWARIKSLINENTANQLSAPKLKVDNSTLNTGGAVTTTLTAAQGGTHFNVDGTGNIVVNMPALSTDNVGLHYSFLVTTAVGGSKTVTFVHPAGGDWIAQISHYENNPYPKGDAAGDTITLQNSSEIGTRVRMLCVQDSGTVAKWMATIEGAASATVPTVAD